MGFGSNPLRGGSGGAAASIDLIGDKALMRALTDLGPRIERKVVNKAVTAGAKILIPVAKANAIRGGGMPSKQLGNLRRSIGMRRARKRRPGSYLIVVGPRSQRRVARQISSVKTRRTRMKVASARESKAIIAAMGKSKTPGIKIVNPGKYAHLVEDGHAGKHPAPAHPFMRPAFESQKYRILSTIQAKLWSGVREEARKLAARSKV